MENMGNREKMEIAVNIENLLYKTISLTKVLRSYCIDEANDSEEVTTIKPALDIILENLHEARDLLDNLQKEYV